MNNLNELSSASRSGTLTVAGTVTEPSGNAPYYNSPGVTNVTVNTSNAAVYADGTFASTNQPIADGQNTYTAIAQDSYGRVDTNSINCYLPASVSYVYDDNGNLLSDGTRNFAYDDENQLTSVWETNVWRQNFVYDGLLRKRVEKDYSWMGSAWQETNEIRYVYDGYLVVQEQDGNNLPQVTYTRGVDLGGSLQGAGGIGGLLARTDMGLWMANQPYASAYYLSDAQGNVVAIVNTNRQFVAQYEYDPFGNIISMTGPLAGSNRYRFSSKEWNDSAGLYYYGFRFYDPILQRWPNRDPLGDPGSLTYLGPSLEQDTDVDSADGMSSDARLDAWTQINLNLYGAVGNDPVGIVDPYGLDWLDTSANFCAGVGDNLTFGLTDAAREALGINGAVNPNSTAYKAGNDTTTGVQLATGVPGIVKTAGKMVAKQAAKDIFKKEAEGFPKQIIRDRNTGRIKGVGAGNASYRPKSDGSYSVTHQNGQVSHCR